MKSQVGRINLCFGADSVEDIIKALEKDGTTWAKDVLAEFAKASPLSLKVTLELLKRGKGQILPECLRMEYRVSQNLLKHEDFYQGVGARKYFLVLICLHD